MKRLLGVALVLLVIAAGAWVYWRQFWTESPTEAWLHTTAAAKAGDEQGFLAGFTDESRPLVAGLLAHARGDDPKTSHQHPYFYLVTENIESVDLAGDTAWLKLRRQTDLGAGTAYEVPLRKDGRTWKIDALQFTGKARVVVKK